MRRATFLASVQDDLLAILTYIADASGHVSIGESFVRALRFQCHKLAAFYGIIGRSRPDLRPDIRSFPYKGYVIFFRYIENRFNDVKET